MGAKDRVVQWWDMDPRRMCPHCRAFITNRDKVCPYCNEPVGLRAIDRRDPRPLLGGLVPAAAFVTVLILVINLGLYVATTLYSMRAGNQQAFLGIDIRTLFDFGAKYRDAILLGQWWRLITAGFLHGGVLHFAFNSWVLFDLGAQTEEHFGAARMIVIYFAATVLGFMGSTWWSPAVSVGASAGLFGLIGAMIALGLKQPTGAVAAARGAYVRWAVYMLLFGLLPGLRVDNAAHIGGLVGGFATAWIAGTPYLARPLIERVWRVAAGICVFLTALAFLNMYLWLASQ
jgi:rhomboid protease GluP